ncbi:hypothetical protein [Bailinhaonella thermotolerans]|uniref:hypothetical protein n=1 Tax=Bailinhaonella thermotolerans TaxID=1070861 RepID=UPI00192A2B1E|nr:hypothetical protein [Bailinhaonella thermotolerans]
MTPDAPAPASPARALPGRAKAVRLALTAVCAGGLVAGTFWWDDHMFPFGPFRMYSTSTPATGNIHMVQLDALMPDGTWRRVPLDAPLVGVNRAEVEGQIPRFKANPGLVSHLVLAHDRLRPHEPRWAGARLRMQYLKLRDRRFVGTEEHPIAEWRRP